MQKRCLLFLSNNCRSWILLVVQSSATKLPQLCGSTYDFWCRQIGRLTTYLLRINCIGMNINLHVAGSTSHLIFKFLFGLRTIHSSHKSGKKNGQHLTPPPKKKSAGDSIQKWDEFLVPVVFRSQHPTCPACDSGVAPKGSPETACRSQSRGSAHLLELDAPELGTKHGDKYYSWLVVLSILKNTI
jgi:hypothetical protein